MDDGRQWQLTLQRLRHQAKRIAGDPGESDEDKQRYRSRFKHEFETLVAAELSKLEAATESAFTDAWSASQEADRAKFERDVAVHTEAIRRAASERGDILKDASGALATIESQPGRAEGESPESPSHGSLSCNAQRDIVGRWMLDELDPQEKTNVELQEEVNRFMEGDQRINLRSYDSSDGSGVYELYKRAYLERHGKPLKIDRRGRRPNRKTGKRASGSS
ncbi:hypothetical protein [Roseiconus lacunae]|uniref:Uncharacterized protein n=1 Tax=Roseiconus lacunae TaxID=2605694 RepID=A0ABT7PN58_9BACT|nr:hypothetical protein [Roseiconus lacunae]MDM4017768.1 hypothetical protein [Roseiconus lacunae]